MTKPIEVITSVQRAEPLHLALAGRIERRLQPHCLTRANDLSGFDKGFGKPARPMTDGRFLKWRPER